MSANEDRDLKDAFEALGSSVRMTELSFDHLTSPEALNLARWQQHRRRAALVLAAIVIPFAVFLRARADHALDYERFTAVTGIDLGEVSWEAPSDFLLDVPGRGLLRGVPVIEIRTPAFVPDSVRLPVPNDTNRRSRS